MTDDPAHERYSLRSSELIELGQLTLRSEREGVVHTIGLIGELDLATADDVQAELERVEATDASSIVLDLSGLTFMDSTGVRALNTALRTAAEHGHELRVAAGMQPAVDQILELTGMLGLLSLEERP